ncbi:ZPBP2 protein, partial [Alectura lathami]|nr:ZPBP2 protein [Alectura lathami]
TVQPGRMLCAPRFWLDPGGPGLLGTVWILTLVLCSYSGQPAFLPGDPPASSSWEYHGSNVFIHMNSSLYSLPCSTVEMEVANPTYSWQQDRSDPKLLSVSEDGHLLFQHFQADDSGNYSCTISYMEHGLPVSQTFHYSVLGYHVLGSLETLLLFHSKLCEEKWTKRFLWNLQDRLKQLEIEQHCKIQLKTTACFPSVDETWDEFVVQAQLEVSLFGPSWDEHCRSQGVEEDTVCYRKTVQHNLEQVRLALTKFFKEHKSFHITGADISSIIFTNKFIGFLEIQQCNVGYGQTKQLQRCLECCIACPPGTFSSPTNRQCSPCPIGTYSLIYGMAFCTPCKNGTITQGPGASSMTDCMEDEGAKQVISIIHKIPLLLLIFLPPLLAVNLLFILSSFYWFHREYQMSSPTASKVVGITKRKETVTKFFGIPWQGPKASPPATGASHTSDMDTSNLDTSTAEGGEEKHTHEASSPTEPPGLAAVDDDTPVVLELEEKKGCF